MHERESARIVEQRLRNRLIEYLDLAGSFERQIAYAWGVPIAYIPHEMLAQWEELWVEGHPRDLADSSTVYSPEEIAAITRFHVAWEDASQAVGDGYPPLQEVHALPEWLALRDEARAARVVFSARGTMPEDREVD